MAETENPFARFRANPFAQFAQAQEQPTGGPRLLGEAGGLRIYDRNGIKYAVGEGYSTSDPERIAEIMAGEDYRDLLASDVRQERIGQAGYRAPLSQVVRGSALGSFADEAYGMVYGPEARDRQRRTAAAYQEEYPGRSLALNLGGASVEAAAAAPLVAPKAANWVVQGGTRLGQVARGMLGGSAVGGLLGGLYGYGEGTDAESRVQEATSGGLLGAGFGGIVGGATPLAREGIENVGRLFRRSDVQQIAQELNISPDAARVIRNTFDQGGDVNAAIVNLNRAGSEAMLADAGPAAQALLDAAKASGGAASREVTEAVQGRLGRTNQAVGQTLDSLLGPAPLGPQTAVDEIAARTAPARAVAYRTAYETPIDYAADAGRNIEAVLDRIPPRVVIEAVNEANEAMRAQGIRNAQILASIGDNGEVIYREMPNVQQLDEIKKALQSLAYNNTDDFGRLNATGQRYNSLARELRDATADAVPDYRTAVQLGGDNIQEQRAFQLGRNLLRANTEIEDLTRELGPNPSQAQQEAARSGLRSYIEKTLGDVRAIASDPTAEAVEARQVIRAVTEMSSPNARTKIRNLLGADADTLLSQIDEAAQSAQLSAATARNSATAARLAQRETVEEVTAPGVIGQAAQGEAIGTTKALIQAVTGQTGEYTAQRRQQIYQDIARALTQKQGDDARAALAVLNRAMEGQSLTDQQTTELARLISGVLFQTGVTGTASARSSGE